MMSPLLRPAFPIGASSPARFAVPVLNVLYRADRRRLDGRHCFAALARIGRSALSRLRYRLAGHLTVADCAVLGRTQGGPERDTISRADIELGRSRQRHVYRIRSQVHRLDGDAEAET